MNRVLITGGCGFIGVNLVQQLIDKNDKVYVLDNNSSGDNFIKNKLVKYYDVDVSQVTDYDFFVEGVIDYVVHLAALPRIQFSLKNPDKVFAANMIGTKNVTAWCAKNKIPLVFAGTSSVHGDKLVNPYTATKYLGEELIKMYCLLYDLNAAILRFYNVYGEPNTYQDDYGLVMTIFEKQFKNNEPLTITGNGNQRRDFTHVSQICDGIIKAGVAMKSSFISGLSEFELGTGQNYSINELAKLFDHPIKHIPARSGEMLSTFADNKKAKKVLAWDPKDLLPEFVEHIQNKYKNKK